MLLFKKKTVRHMSWPWFYDGISILFSFLVLFFFFALKLCTQLNNLLYHFALKTCKRFVYCTLSFLILWISCCCFFFLYDKVSLCRSLNTVLIFFLVFVFVCRSMNSVVQPIQENCIANKTILYIFFLSLNSSSTNSLQTK